MGDLVVVDGEPFPPELIAEMDTSEQPRKFSCGPQPTAPVPLPHGFQLLPETEYFHFQLLIHTCFFKVFKPCVSSQGYMGMVEGTGGNRRIIQDASGLPF